MSLLGNIVIHIDEIHAIDAIDANNDENQENMIINNIFNNISNKPKKSNHKSKKSVSVEAKDGLMIEEDDRGDRNDCDKKRNTKRGGDNGKVNKHLSIKNYETLLTHNYKMDELRKICLQYKIPRGGNKVDLMDRIFTYFKMSIYPLKIQKVFRGFLQRKLIKLKGSALFDRKICTNDTDFFTMDTMDEIQYNQFFSYTDVDGFVYGFNILSLYNLIIKGDDNPKNPYNRNEISNKIKEGVNRVIKISRILKIPIEIEIKQEIIDPRKRLEMKILELFQVINSYGNYSNSEWFTDLSRGEHIKFARELVDIWNYRAQLTVNKKNEICPPHGNPFLATPYYANTASYTNLNNLSNDTLVKFNVQIIENLVKTAIDVDNRTLGSFYVLSALTLVSEAARNAMPWLYEAAVNIP